MRPQQHDPRPEFGMPAPRDAGRYDDAPSGPQSVAGPYTGPTPYTGPNPYAANPVSGPQPVSAPVGALAGRYGTGAYPVAPYAAAPYSGPHQAVPRPATGSWGMQDQPLTAREARDRAEPTVRRHLADEVAPTHYEAAPRGYEDPRDVHPSGPLPTGSGHRRGGGRGGRKVLLALVAAGAVAVGAGGYVALAQWGSSSDPVATTAGANVAPAAATSMTGANLGSKQTPLGIVATSDGYTLYSFTKDSNKPAASTCNGSCAEQWPPVLAADGDPWLKGVDASKVGTVERTDGTKQLTLNGWPLYRYAKDTAPGQADGNGVGGTWRAVGPDGKPVAPAAAAEAPAAPAAPAAG
ncbi:hypothetical protein, partial [Actinomycetospora atypica]